MIKSTVQRMGGLAFAFLALCLAFTACNSVNAFPPTVTQSAASVPSLTSIPTLMPTSTPTQTPLPTPTQTLTPTPAVPAESLLPQAKTLCDQTTSFPKLVVGGSLPASSALTVAKLINDLPMIGGTPTFSTWKAPSASDVKLIVCIVEKAILAGGGTIKYSYADGAAAYVLVWDVRLLAWPTGQLIAKTTLSAFPPSTKYYSGPGYGTRPSKDLENWLNGWTQLTRHIRVGEKVAISPDFGTLASQDAEGRIALWNAETGQWIRTLTSNPISLSWSAGQSSFFFSPDGNILASKEKIEEGRFYGSVDLVLRDRSTGQTVFTLRNGSYATFAPDGKIILFDADDGFVLWDVKTRQKERTIQVSFSHTDIFRRMTLSPDGRILAAMTVFNDLKLWDTTTGQEIRMATSSGGVDRMGAGLDFSPDGRILAISNEQGTPTENRVLLLDPKTGQIVRALAVERELPTAEVVNFSPDGKTLVASMSGTLRLWDTATWQEISTIKADNVTVTALTFSSDSKSIASVSEDGTVKFWQLPTRK